MRTQWIGSVILISVFLGALAAGNGVLASDVETSIDMQVRYRGEADRKEFDAGLGFDTFQLLRTRVGLTTMMGSSQDTKGRILIQDSRTLGRPRSGTTARDVSLGIYEAYLEVEDFVFQDLIFRAGRFPMAYGNERIIGAVGWSNIGRTFDAVRARVKKGEWIVDGFWAKLTEANQNRNRDQDLFGLYAQGSQIGADVFLLHDLDSRRIAYEEHAGEKTLKRWTAGAYSQRTFSRDFDYIANAVFQFGRAEGNDVQAFLAAVEVGYKVSGDVDYRVAAGVDLASGDDDPEDEDMKAFNNEYYTGHKFRGFMDLFVSSGNEGLMDLYLRQSLKLEDGWALAGDIHYFKTAEDYVLGSDEPNGNGSDKKSSRVGVEVDLTARAPMIGAAAVQLGVSGFFPAEDYAAYDGQSESDPGFWGYVMLTVTGR